MQTEQAEQELEQLEALRRSGTAVSESQLYSRRDDEHLTEEQRRERDKLEEKLKPRPLDKVAGELREMVILGDPGAGKSECWVKRFPKG